MRKWLYIVFPYSWRARMRRIREEFGKLAELWKVTPADCRIQLLEEFVFRPEDFECRFQEEIGFQWNLVLGFRREKE